MYENLVIYGLIACGMYLVFGEKQRPVFRIKRRPDLVIGTEALTGRFILKEK